MEHRVDLSFWVTRAHELTHASVFIGGLQSPNIASINPGKSVQKTRGMCSVVTSVLNRNFKKEWEGCVNRNHRSLID